MMFSGKGYEEYHPEKELHGAARVRFREFTAPPVELRSYQYPINIIDKLSMILIQYKYH